MTVTLPTACMAKGLNTEERATKMKTHAEYILFFSLFVVRVQWCYQKLSRPERGINKAFVIVLAIEDEESSDKQPPAQSGHFLDRCPPI